MRAQSGLPRPLSSFIGRADLLADAARLLEHNRLLTLTGPGGSGKTRLGIELATRAGPDYPDGAYFVPLAAIRDPALVPSSIAQSLGLQDSRDRQLVEHLAAYLGDRVILLVLDNFEQVIAGAPIVAALLAAGTGTRIVVTSRSRLRLSGEQELPVPPLPVPDAGAETSADSLTACDSAALFVARARAVAPRFAVGEGNAAAIAGIVRRLDGLPLAIELAAARVTVLPPADILARLDHSLRLLVGGNRDLPDRQQTLRSTIGWSYELLGDDARDLFTVLSVFRGGASLADLDSVCASSVCLGVPVEDALQELADQGLLRLSAAEPRYAMLETVREYAAERLAERPHADRVRAAHAAVFAALAERIDRPPIWPDNSFLALLDRDHDNLRAALDWLQDHDPAAALRMAAHLTAFWSVRGHFTEGRRRLRILLDRVHEPTPERVAALCGAGWLALDQGDEEQSIGLLDASVRLADAIHDRIGAGTALLSRGRTSLGRRGTEASARDLARALELLTDAGDAAGTAAAMMFHGLAPLASGDFPVARARFADCVARCGELGLATLRARALQLLGIAALHDGDLVAGRAALTEAVPVVVDSGDRYGIAISVGGLIMLAGATDRPRLAMRLVGVLDEYARLNQVAPPQPMAVLTERFLGPARAAVGTSAGALCAEGRRLSVADAVAAVLSDEPEQPWRTGPGPGLTRRETQVAKLVASGLTNREIAERLYLSVRTVDVHVDRVLGKLAFHTRGQLTAWAHERGLMAEDT